MFIDLDVLKFGVFLFTFKLKYNNDVSCSVFSTTYTAWYSELNALKVQVVNFTRDEQNTSTEQHK